MRSRIVATITLACGLTACSMSSTELGGGGSMVQGSAGEAGNAQNEATALRHCDQPLGTMALVEDQSSYGLAQYGLESPVPLLRLLASQSNCFAVVERGQGARPHAAGARPAATSGLLQTGSNVGGAQIIAADYLLTPYVTSRKTTRAGSAARSARRSAAFCPTGSARPSARWPAACSSAKRRPCSTVADQRSGLQIAVAEGSAKTSDILGGAFALGGLPGFAGLGGFANTNQGKVVSAAFLDAFNSLVDQLAARPPS